MVLVDTSAWIHHLRASDLRLVAFLSEERVRTSDVIVGELLLGAGLPAGFAVELGSLPSLPSPTAVETRSFVERHGRSLRGAGIGWADAQIVLTAKEAGARLYSADRAVRRVCRLVGTALA